MLPKKQRLGRAAFSAVFAAGQRLHDQHYTVVYISGSVFKAAVVVGKKVAKKAHERNTIRRRLYAALAQEYRAGRILGTYIVLVKPAVASLSRLDQVSALTQLLSRMTKGR